VGQATLVVDRNRIIRFLGCPLHPRPSPATPFPERVYHLHPTVEHMTLVDSMTSYSTSDKSKTIFEAVYGVVPNVDSLPPIGCFACRLEEIKDKTDKKLGIGNTVGTFVGSFGQGFIYVFSALRTVLARALDS